MHQDDAKDFEGEQLFVLIFRLPLDIDFYLKDWWQDDLSLMDGAHGTLQYFIIISKGMSSQEN